MASDSTNKSKHIRLLRNLFGATQRFSYKKQCKTCESLTKYGRRVKVFGNINLNASTDDFVIYGYVQFIGRSICLLSLGILLSILFKETMTEDQLLFNNVFFILIVVLTGVRKSNVSRD